MAITNAVVKSAPKLFAIGVALFGSVGVGLTVRATLKSVPIIEEAKEDLKAIKAVREEKTEEEYPTKVYRRELSHIYLENGKKIGVNYITAFMFLAAATGCGIGEFIGFKRQLGAEAAKAANAIASATLIKKGYDAYRKNVREDLGDDADKKYAYGIEECEVVDIEVDEKGKEKKTKKKAKFARRMSPFAVVYDSFCPNHSKDPKQNFKYLKDMEQYFQDQAKMRDNHRVWCCEITTSIGCKLTKEQEKLMQSHFYQYDPETGEGLPIFIMSDDICRSFITGETDEHFESEYQEHIARLDIPDTQDARNYFKHNYYDPEILVELEPNGNWENL